MPKASVKIMLSYDYCHFEIALEDEMIAVSSKDVDELRKQAQRLADKAVKQYQIAKKEEASRIYREGEIERLEKEVKVIKENYPKSEWTEHQKATIKLYEDFIFAQNKFYDYQDDWEVK